MSATTMSPRILPFRSANLAWAVMGLVVAIIALVPILFAVDSAFRVQTAAGLGDEYTLSNIERVFLSAEYMRPLLRAVTLALVVTILSMIVGVATAFLVTRTDLPGKSVWDILILTPMFLSPFVGLVAWITLGSRETGMINVMLRSAFPFLGDRFALVDIWTWWGMVWVMFLTFCPFVYLFMQGPLRRMDSSLEEAARMSGAPYGWTLWKITLPLMRPALVATVLLIFVMAVEMYTIPGMIGPSFGYITLPWKIVADATLYPIQRGHAAAAGILLLAITLVGMWLQRRLTSRAERYVTVGGKGFRSEPVKLGRFKWPALLLCGAYVALAVVLPFVSLTISSFMRFSSSTLNAEIFTTIHYSEIFARSDTFGGVMNSIYLAIAAGALCLLVGFLISYGDIKGNNRTAKILAILGVLPIAVPGFIYSLGIMEMYVRTVLYGTAFVMLIAHVAKLLPYAILVPRAGLLQMSNDLEESARTTGAGWARAFVMVTIPLLKPVLVAVFFFSALNSMKELSASVLLYSPRFPLLSVQTFHATQSGDYQLGAAMSVVQTVIMLAIVILTRMIFRVRLEKGAA